VIVAAVGSLWQSSWDWAYLFAKRGPYANTVGGVGLPIVAAVSYLLNSPNCEQKNYTDFLDLLRLNLKGYNLK
jgi:hypothetical protein